MLSDYIRLDTTNPPGGEAQAASFLQRILTAEGIETRLVETAPGRANLIARLRATEATGGAILLLHHMDVVPAGPADAGDGGWTVPPFDGVVKDGYVWGRGAVDDKGLGTIHLLALVLLKALGVPLRRDVILMAVSDEETGGGLGARRMVEHHWDDIECEYVWDEGGSGSHGIVGNRPIFAISVWEKRSMVVRVLARGGGGHASFGGAGAIDRLARALSRLGRAGGGPRFNDVSREFLRGLAQTQSFPASWLLCHPDFPLTRRLLSARLGRIPALHAMTRDTMTPTVLRAGEQANVAPDLAEATVDVRLLPDTDGQALVERIRAAVAGDGVTIEAGAVPDTTPASLTGSPMYKAMAASVQKHLPGAITAPFLTPVATDSRFFRRRGVDAYGLLPVVLTQRELDGIHGVDERISAEGLTLGVKIALDVLLQMTGA